MGKIANEGEVYSITGTMYDISYKCVTKQRVEEMNGKVSGSYSSNQLVELDDISRATPLYYCFNVCGLEGVVGSQINNNSGVMAYFLDGTSYANMVINTNINNAPYAPSGLVRYGNNYNYVNTYDSIPFILNPNHETSITIGYSNDNGVGTYTIQLGGVSSVAALIMYNGYFYGVWYCRVYSCINPVEPEMGNPSFDSSFNQLPSLGSGWEQYENPFNPPIYAP